MGPLMVHQSGQGLYEKAKWVPWELVPHQGEMYSVVIVEILLIARKLQYFVWLGVLKDDKPGGNVMKMLKYLWFAVAKNAEAVNRPV